MNVADENSTKPIKVLLIEDNEDDYILARRGLARNENHEFIVDWESTFDGGLAAILKKNHDVYLFDYKLGPQTGLDLLKKALENGCDAPIIFLTGSGNEIVATEALRAGATDYVTKESMSGKSLSRAITNSIEKAELRRHLEAHQTHLEATNQQLARKNEEIKRFYHTVAHELKTPLTAGREFAAIIGDGLAGTVTEEQREYLSLIKDTFTQMAVIINDLLDVTRIETGKFSIHQHSSCLDTLIPRLVAGLSSAALRKGVRLEFIVAPSLPEAFIDEQRIAQVINNLLSNAVKFTPSGGEVTLRASLDPQDSSKIRISVQDTGCGIEPNEFDRIFDRLYQVQDDHERVEGGLGLGLNISQEVVKLHGGTLAVDSVPGEGSLFSFQVPVCSQEPVFENRIKCTVP